MDPLYYTQQSTGILQFDPGQGSKHYRDGWAILQTDDGIRDYYCWLSKTKNIKIEQNRLWGPHVSCIKGEIPVKNIDLWGSDFGIIEFHYSNTIRYDNGCHAWLDIWCPKLNEIRVYFGLVENPFGDHPRHYHMTLGRWNEGRLEKDSPQA